MIPKTLPGLLLALALPAAAAPNRPPSDNSYCVANATAAGIRATFTVTPSGGGAPVERILEVGAGQNACVVAVPGWVELRAEQPGRRECRARRDATAGQMQVNLRVTAEENVGLNAFTPILACRDA